MPAVPVLLLCVKPANQSVALPMNIKIYSPQTRGHEVKCVRVCMCVWSYIVQIAPVHTWLYPQTKLAITILKEISAKRNLSFWVVENVFENIFLKSGNLKQCLNIKCLIRK